METRAAGLATAAALCSVRAGREAVAGQGGAETVWRAGLGVLVDRAEASLVRQQVRLKRYMNVFIFS